MVSNSQPYCVSQHAGTSLIGRNILYYHTVPSTNEIAGMAARSNTEEGTVIIAEEQTGGRGRLERSWLSPPGSLSLSIILYPELSRLPYLIMAASLAVSRTIKAISRIKADIKWPNDILINGKKVCGILIENGLKGNSVQYSVIGIGINLNVSVNNYPEIVSTAISLSDAVVGRVPAALFTQRLLLEFENLYLSGGSVFDEWQNSLITLGKKVTSTSGALVIEGIAESVNPDGSLIIKQTGGSLFKAVAGEVTLRI